MWRLRSRYAVPILAIAALVTGGILWYALSRSRGAPAASDLPLARGTQLIAVSQDQGDDNLGWFTDMAITGPAGETLAELARREIVFLKRKGWAYAYTGTFVGTSSAASAPRRVAIGTPGSFSILNDRAAHIYAVIDPVAGLTDYESAGLRNGVSAAQSVRVAFANGRPVISVTLGNGTNR